MRKQFKITKREMVVSIFIISIMLIIGTFISSKISEHGMDKNEEYNKAIKINDDKNLFQYGMDTNIGNAFVYGKLEAVDTVTYPEIGDAYMSIKKIKERYTQHTRLVTKTRDMPNGKSETYTEEEVYWTWDEISRWTQNCNKVTFLDVEFNFGDIYTPDERYLTTIVETGDTRYIYYGSATNYIGTLFTELNNSTINGAIFYNNKTIDETLQKLESNMVLVWFWIIWITILVYFVYGFYYLDNNWLEG